MTIYAGKSVRLVSLLVVLVSATLFLGFCFFMDRVGSRMPWLNISFVLILSVTFASQFFVFLGLWFRPTLQITPTEIFIPSFPMGKKSIARKDIIGLKKQYFGLSPILELEFKAGQKVKRALLAVPKNLQDQVVIECGKSASDL